MPGSGLIALLDDIATIADDVSVLTTLAAKKATGIVTDDMAVTAEQAIGIRREREIPVVVAVAKGSLKNKALILAPGALLLNAVAPWAILPLLMVGGAFLAFEGVAKILHPSEAGHDGHGAAAEAAALSPEAFEKKRIDGAIRTDMILSGEIIAITLGEVASAPFVTQVAVLYAISIIMTVGVYGLVGVLVKIDDAGELLVGHGGFRAAIGRFLVAAAPKLLRGISLVGTAAMLMVGGSILLHGFHPAEAAIHQIVEASPSAVHGLVTALADIAVGGAAGVFIVGVLRTGIPGKILGMFKKKRANGAGAA